MRNALAVLVAAAVATVTFPAAADEPVAGPDVAPSYAPPGAGGSTAAIAPSAGHGLGQIHGGTTADGARTAGSARDVELSAKGAAGKVVRPQPTPRTLRRMSSDRVLASIDANARACATDNPSAQPKTVELRVSIAPSGEIEGAESSASAKVAPALLACVVKTVTAARFGAPGGQGASIVLPLTIPGRVAAAVAPSAAVVAEAPAPAAAPAAPAAPAVGSKPAEVVAAKQ